MEPFLVTQVHNDSWFFAFHVRSPESLFADSIKYDSDPGDYGRDQNETDEDFDEEFPRLLRPVSVFRVGSVLLLCDLQTAFSKKPSPLAQLLVWGKSTLLETSNTSKWDLVSTGVYHLTHHSPQASTEEAKSCVLLLVRRISGMFAPQPCSFTSLIHESASGVVPPIIRRQGINYLLVPRIIKQSKTHR